MTRTSTVDISVASLNFTIISTVFQNYEDGPGRGCTESDGDAEGRRCDIDATTSSTNGARFENRAPFVAN